MLEVVVFVTLGVEEVEEDDREDAEEVRDVEAGAELRLERVVPPLLRVLLLVLVPPLVRLEREDDKELDVGNDGAFGGLALGAGGPAFVVPCV